MTPELTPDAAKGPERIWIDPNTTNPHLENKWWVDGHDESDIEYLRADTVAKMMREAYRNGRRNRSTILDDMDTAKLMDECADEYVADHVKSQEDK